METESKENKENKKESKFDYSKIAFMLKRPLSKSILRGPYGVSDRDGHRQLLNKAKAEGLYLWHTAVVDNNGKRATHGPHIIDFDSVPDGPPGPGAKFTSESESSYSEEPVKIECPHCGKVCHSRPGYTLHLKTHDGDEPGEDKKLLQCPHCEKQCSSTSGLTLHIKNVHSDKPIEQVVVPIEVTTESNSAPQGLDKLQCPHCKKKCSSTSGLTLHMKSHGV